MHNVEIRVKGRLDQHWSSWFDGLMITHTKKNETVLSGAIPDQAALHGLLSKLRDLHLPIVSVHLSEVADPEEAAP
jgi:hypothetical protein